MASWDEVERLTPDLAARVRAVFDAHKHKTLATLRADGSPRISGTEVDFRDGEAWCGSMWNARKARDLQRDPRFSLHSATADPEMASGDAKISGRAIEMSDDAKQQWAAAYGEQAGEEPPEPMHLFRLDVTELVLTTLGDPPDHLVVESWHADRGDQRIERR
ncbi:MAG: pyridoxamine 5'-phosphate oxidase family protein [Actinomycetota bacterium]